jgi:hypothetical protein
VRRIRLQVCTMLFVSAWPGHNAAGHGQQDEAQNPNREERGCACVQRIRMLEMPCCLSVPRLAALLQDTASRVSTLV